MIDLSLSGSERGCKRGVRSRKNGNGLVGKGEFIHKDLV
jgi:hypothetical protein